MPDDTGPYKANKGGGKARNEVKRGKQVQTILKALKSLPEGGQYDVKMLNKHSKPVVLQQVEEMGKLLTEEIENESSARTRSKEASKRGRKIVNRKRVRTRSDGGTDSELPLKHYARMRGTKRKEQSSQMRSSRSKKTKKK